MHTKPLWSDQIPEKDGVQNPINDIAVSPDGSRVIVAVGNRVLLYKTDNGDLIESLRGHKDTVYCVSFSSDGTRFASGGADNIVVIWKSSGQGLLKYNHTSPIQRVKYNPTMLLLASCSDTDFGLWTPDQKQVTKEKMPSRITSAAWSTDGTMLALGTINGLISIRNQQAEELQRIERRAPIWSLAFLPEVAGPKAPAPLTGNTGSQQNPAQEQSNLESLAVGCWDKTYSVYKLQSATQHKLQNEKFIKYYPCSMVFSTNHISKTTYMLVGGSNNAVTMYSREGVKLTEVARKKSWVWCVDTHGDSDTMALGSNGGAIDFMKIDFEPVHALFRDRFAYRENLTEVIVHHLVTDKKVRIKCKDLIHNLSLFKNKLAVQLSDRVCIYESSLDDSTDMHFRLRKEKISIVDHRDKIANTTKSHNLMIITSLYLIFSAGNVIELYAFDGQRQKFWTVDAQVTCMRIDGGSEGKEGVLAGLSNGAIIKFYVDNPFIIEVSQRGSAIAQLDINVYRTLIAYVDANNLMSVIDLHTQEVLYTTPGVIYACFNTEVEDLICITSLDSSISVVSGFHSASTGKSSSGNAPSLDVQEQHIFGLALGFRSQKIFCLNKGSIVGVDVPQGYNIQRALENNDIPTAYKIACLGATEADWKMLGMKSLRANYLHIAKNAFARLKDTKFLSLIDNIERTGPVIQQQKPKPVVPETKNDAPTSRRNRLGLEPAPSRTTTSQYPTLTIPPLDSSWVAEMLAYEGHHQEAAKLYARSGKLREAIRLFTDLRQWEDAKMFARNAGQADVSELTVQQANWLQEINDWKGSSELFITMGQFMPAAKIIVENQDEGWQDALIEVVRACPADNIETLDYCGEKFAAFNETVYARETYAKSKDVSKLMALYAKRHMWNEAAKLADENEGKFDVSIFLSYAEWLVSQDRYMEAIQAFKKSNRIDLACNVLLELAENAVAENRFKDAAYYFWLLSKEADLQQEQQEKEQQQAYDGKDEFGDKKSKKLATQRLLVNHYDYVHKADLYFAYANVHTYVTDPFTSHQPEMLFQVSRFIINSLGSSEIIPNGISKANTLYTLARQSMALGAFKLARHAYDRLSKLQMTDRKTEEIEIDMLLVQAKPVRDSPDHLPVCYRCSSTNPLLNPFTNKYAKGDVCTNCGHPFVRSFINFDILPLVEFVPEPAISDEEAIELIRQPPASKGNPFYSSMGSATGNESKAGGWKESKQSGAEMLTFDGPDGGEYGEADVIGDDDQFTKCVNFTLEKQKSTYTPVKVDTNTLLAMKRSEVFVCKPTSTNKRATFYKNMLPDLPIAISQPCHRFFHLEDFEFAYLSEQKCPYSRLRNVGEYGSL